MTGGPTRAQPTPSQTVGPFFRFALDWLAIRPMIPPGSPEALTIWGHVLDGAGEAVPDAMVEVYQAGPGGPAPVGWRPFGRACTDPAGQYSFTTAKPDNREDGQAPHLDVSIFARGLLQRLWTRCYFPDEALANASDPVLQAIPEADRVATLMARHDPAGLRFDIRLQGDHETVFFDW